jgi:uncharacterized protein
MFEEIIKRIEKENKVKIVWAIESGSRAWGFASEDSDYDIRCMHISKIDDYLGLDLPAQQINFSQGIIDLESWDIKKFGELTLKSNPQIAEWLRSQVVYRESQVRKQFRKYFDEGCSLDFLRQHYLRMSSQNYHKYMAVGMAHSCKKYLYVLRGIACAAYIEKEKRLPPLPYKEVIPYLPNFARDFFEKCVIVKNTTEKAKIVANEKVTRFIESQIQQFGKVDNSFGKRDELNDYIVKTIKQPSG